MTCNNDVVPLECTLESNKFSLEEVRDAQKNDEDIKIILKFVDGGVTPTRNDRAGVSKEVRNLLSQEVEAL